MENSKRIADRRSFALSAHRFPGAVFVANAVVDRVGLRAGLLICAALNTAGAALRWCGRRCLWRYGRCFPRA